MDKTEFILLAKQSCYAANKEPLLLGNGEKVITFENDEFKYVDEYYGYTPFGGQEVIFKKTEFKLEPIWLMNYGGTCLDITDRYMAEGIFRFLKTALSQIDKYHPFRGPRILEKENFWYKSIHSGGIDCFSGTEEIFFDGTSVYMGRFFGGMIQSKTALDIGI